MEKTLKLEISHTTSSGKVHYGTLELPASELEIEDSLQQARTNAEHQEFDELAVYHCKPLRGLLGKRLDGSSIKELNFFAKRLELLDEDEKPVLQAVVQKYLEGKDENQLVSIKDFINMTYGLDKVSVLSAVSNDAQLGQFVIENDLHPDIEKLRQDRFLSWTGQQSGDGCGGMTAAYLSAINMSSPEIMNLRKYMTGSHFHPKSRKKGMFFA